MANEQLQRYVPLMKAITDILKGPRTTTSVCAIGITAAILLLGTYFRIKMLLSPRELWIDEVQLSLYVIEVDWSGILAPINAAPLFIALQKLAYALLGHSDITLRTIPFCFGMATIVAGFFLSRTTLSTSAAIPTLALFAISTSLVYYSGEAKQYSADAFFSIVLILCALREEEKQWGQLITSLALLLLTVWFSQPSWFFIATFFLYRFLRGDRSIVNLLTLSLPLVVSFFVLYFYSFKSLAADSFLQNFWVSAFMPMPPWSYESVHWLSSRFSVLVELPSRGIPFWITCSLLVIGSIYWLRKKPTFYFLLVLPIILCIATSATRWYPFDGGRLQVFLIPSLILIQGGAFEWTASILSRFKVPSLASTAVVSLLLCLPTAPAVQRMYEVMSSRHALKDISSYISAHALPNDIVAASLSSTNALKYYSTRFSLPKLDLRPLQELEVRINSRLYPPIEGLEPRGRLWIWFSDFPPKSQTQQIRQLATCFVQQHTLFKYEQFSPASIALIDFSASSDQTHQSIRKCLATLRPLGLHDVVPYTY